MTNFKDEIERAGYIVYTCKGASMMPLIREGKDVVLIEKLNRPYTVGDAVLFLRSDGAYILHRIKKKLRDGRYFIIGDNCVSGDIVEESQILGIMTELTRDGETVKADSKEMRRYIRRTDFRIFYRRIYIYCAKKYHRIIKRG